jgi:hypothetical protein
MRPFAILFPVLALALTFTACNKPTEQATPTGSQPIQTQPTPDKPTATTAAAAKVDPELARQQAEELYKQVPKMANDLADSLEKIKDEKEALAKAIEFNQNLGGLMAKVNATKVAPEEFGKIQAKNAAEFQKAQMRVLAACKNYPKVNQYAFAPPERSPVPLGPGEKEVKPVQLWNGSVENADPKVVQKAFEAARAASRITDAKAFGQLWAAVKPGEKPPELDFGKVFVIHHQSQFAKVKIDIHLRDKDDLYIDNQDSGPIEPGFRYVIMAISRDGINSANHVPLPK